MDTKIGKVYLQPHKAGKKWKPVWLSLFPPSSSGVGRLEIQGVGGGGAGGDHSSGVRRHHQPLGEKKLKVVRLSELISVLRLPPNAEACPMENMSAFCVETQERTMVFAAHKDDCVDWVEKLCHSAFQRGEGLGSNQPHMEENQIYASADEATEFWVVVQRTDAATRCGLQGSYWLQVGRVSLLLKDTHMKNVVREWPYELLRRYGKDKLALSIEAGRRCDSGPGTFSFETQQAEKIFNMIQNNIKWKTTSFTSGNPSPEDDKVTVTNIQAHSPLPKIPDKISMAAILENNQRTEERKCASLERSLHVPEEVATQSESPQPAPITLMPLPLVPTHDNPSGGLRRDQSDSVYADPADCIQPVPKLQPPTALYVDPAKVLPLKPPCSREPVTPLSNSPTTHPCLNNDQEDPVYSEVYDKVCTDQRKPAVIQSKGKIDDEPIYTEPISGEKEPTPNDPKPDPFAHLYAQVCKPVKSSSHSTPVSTAPSSSTPSITTNTTTAKDMGHSFDDVIYENLGII